MPADGQLFANSFGSGRSFIFDLSKPSAPRLAKQFGNMGALMVRSTSSDYAGVDRRIRPYSSAILPDIDRVVVTTTDMDNRDATQALQLWRWSSPVTRR